MQESRAVIGATVNETSEETVRDTVSEIVVKLVRLLYICCVENRDLSFYIQ